MEKQLNVITLINEETGEEYELALLDYFPMEDDKYAILTPQDKISENQEGVDIYIFNVLQSRSFPPLSEAKAQKNKQFGSCQCTNQFQIVRKDL